MPALVVTALFAICIAIGAVFWARPVVQAAPPPTIDALPMERSLGAVGVSAKIEHHWSKWNGGMALVAHRGTTIHNGDDLARSRLLIPTFTYGSFDGAAVEAVHREAKRFAADAGMAIETEPRLALFRARLLAEPDTIALVPSSLSSALGLDSAAAFQHLVLEKRSGP